MIKQARNNTIFNLFNDLTIRVLVALCLICLVFQLVGCVGMSGEKQFTANVRKIVVEKYVEGSVYKYKKVGEFDGDSHAAKQIMLAMEKSSPEIVVFSTRYVLVLFHDGQEAPVRYAVGDRAFSSRGLGVYLSEENIEEIVENLLTNLQTNQGATSQPDEPTRQPTAKEHTSQTHSNGDAILFESYEVG